MNRSGLIMVTLMCVSVSITWGKTSQQLKEDLASIMPDAMKARMVWLQTTGSNGNIYGVDSDDGIIRKINATSIKAGDPWLTADGRRVVYYEELTGNIEVINFESGGPAPRVVAQGSLLWSYWQSPNDNSDWIVTGGRGNTVVRRNIDTQEEVVLYNGSAAAEGSPQMGISKDGTRLSAYFEGSRSWDPGVVNISVSTSRVVYPDHKGGCGMDMAPDNSYDYFVHWGEGHHAIRLYNNSTPVDSFGLVDGILAWADRENVETCDGNREYGDAKWTNHRDYVTFSMFNTKANPYVLRLSDGKWICLFDTIGCNTTHGLDVVFMPSGQQQNAAPIIAGVSDVNAMVHSRFSRTISVSGLPLPTLSASGLPAGISIENGETPSSTFTISGTPSTVGTYAVTLTARNSQGIAVQTFTCTVVNSNAPPEVNAGVDVAINLGNSCRLSGAATDDGVPQPLSVTWTLVSGNANNAVIAAPGSLSSLVTFSTVGEFLFELAAYDGAITGKDTVRVTVNDAVPFVVHGFAQNEVVRIGDTKRISWQIDPPGTAVVIELTTDDAETWEYLISASYYDSVFQWTVGPDILSSNQCFIRVCEYGDRTICSQSQSFAIDSASSTIRRLQKATVSDVKSFDYYTVHGRKLRTAPTNLINSSHGIVIRAVQNRPAETKKVIVE